MCGDKIKEIRLANHMNQVQFAKILGLSKQSISNWESNRAIPSIKVVVKICKKFSCSADFLLEISDDNNVSVDMSGLSLEQAAHVKQIVDDFVLMNKKSKLY